MYLLFGRRPKGDWLSVSHVMSQLSPPKSNWSSVHARGSLNPLILKAVYAGNMGNPSFFAFGNDLERGIFFGQVEIRKCTLCVAVSCGLFAKTIQETRAIRLPTLMYADRAPEVHVETARHSLRCPFRRWMRKFPKSHVGLIQGSRIRLVLGCVISPLRQYAESRNLGQTLFGSPVRRLQCRLCPEGGRGKKWTNFADQRECEIRVQIKRTAFRIVT